MHKASVCILDRIATQALYTLLWCITLTTKSVVYDVFINTHSESCKSRTYNYENTRLSPAPKRVPSLMNEWLCVECTTSAKAVRTKRRWLGNI